MFLLCCGLNAGRSIGITKKRLKELQFAPSPSPLAAPERDEMEIILESKGFEMHFDGFLEFLARLSLALFERDSADKVPSNCIKSLLQHIYSHLYLGRKASNSSNRRAALLCFR